MNYKGFLYTGRRKPFYAKQLLSSPTLNILYLNVKSKT